MKGRQIPLAQLPNQTFSTSLNGETWQITLETKLGKMYISLESSSRGLVLANRVCLNKAYLGYGFSFLDIDGNSDPVYTGLNERFLLLWLDESEL